MLPGLMRNETGGLATRPVFQILWKQELGGLNYKL